MSSKIQLGVLHRLDNPRFHDLKPSELAIRYLRGVLPRNIRPTAQSSRSLN